MLPALILAGGASTRMGSPKALLPDDEGRPFVTRIARTLLSAGLDTIVIVTGAHHAGIAEAVAGDAATARIRLVRNPDPSRGQLSSLWTGMDAAVAATTEGLLVTLVDVPLVTASTVEVVVRAWRARRAPIVRPLVGDRRGHPVIFDQTTFGELRSASLATGAREVVRAHRHDALDVPVDDPGALVDVDTHGDYRALADSWRPPRA